MGTPHGLIILRSLTSYPSGDRIISNPYYDATDKMEKAGVNPDYILGWQSGYTHNPEIEEQNRNEVYEAGYADGKARNSDGYADWT